MIIHKPMNVVATSIFFIQSMVTACDVHTAQLLFTIQIALSIFVLQGQLFSLNSSSQTLSGSNILQTAPDAPLNVNQWKWFVILSFLYMCVNVWMDVV